MRLEPSSWNPATSSPARPAAADVPAAAAGRPGLAPAPPPWPAAPPAVAPARAACPAAAPAAPARVARVAAAAEPAERVGQVSWCQQAEGSAAVALKCVALRTPPMCMHHTQRAALACVSAAFGAGSVGSSALGSSCSRCSIASSRTPRCGESPTPSGPPLPVRALGSRCADRRCWVGKRATQPLLPVPGSIDLKEPSMVSRRGEEDRRKRCPLRERSGSELATKHRL